jgi:hypothetical protein
MATSNLTHAELAARWRVVRAEVLRRHSSYLNRDGRGIPKSDAWLGIYTYILHHRTGGIQ